MKNTSFLAYCQMILEKVSFDSDLLKKEYEKAKQLLHPNELPVLDQWMASQGLDRLLERKVTVEVG